MSEEQEVKLKEPMYLITEDYGVGFDKMNIILMERFQKRAGRGKNADLIDEYAWRDLGYFGNLDAVARFLLKKEFVSQEQLSDLSMIVDRLDDLTDRIVEAVRKIPVPKVD